MKIEQRGIERVPEDERHDTSMLNISTMWFSANMVVSSFALGGLGPQLFYTGFVDGLLVIIFFNLLGIFSVCFFSSFGPVFGLRQMVLSRFWFGWWGVKLSMLEQEEIARSGVWLTLYKLLYSICARALVGLPSTL